VVRLCFIEHAMIFAKSVFSIIPICKHDILLLFLVILHDSGTACNNAGIVHSFNFEPVNSLLPAAIESLRPELSRKVADLTQSLNK